MTGWAASSRRLLSTVLPLLALACSLAAVLRTPYVPLDRQAFPDAPEYVDAATHLSKGDGYRTTVETGKLEPPRYPPGFPLFLVPFVRLAPTPQQGAEVATRIVALALATAIWLAALLIGGRLSSVFAGGIVTVSPFVPDMARQALSDGLASLLVAACIIMLAARRRIPLLVGIVAGAAVAVRLSLVVVPAAVMAAGPKIRLAVVTAVAATLPVSALLGYQWATFGSPLRTGYEYHLPEAKQFSLEYVTASGLQGEGEFVAHARLGDKLMGWVCPCPDDDPMRGLPNLFFYPLLLLGLYWVFTPPLLSLVGVWALVVHRRAPSARFGLATVLGTLLLALPYYGSSARLAAPAGVVLVVFSAVGVAELLSRVLRLRSARDEHAGAGDMAN